jgi:hypothetical protein
LAGKPTTHVIRGTLHWAKVLGEPRMNTFTEEREWSVDVTPNATGRDEIKRIGIADKLKTPKSNDSRKDTFVAFRQKEFRKDYKTGEMVKNRPIKIVDVQGNEWPANVMIGNGTEADVKFNVVKTPGKPTGAYIQAIRVLSLVQYEIQEFAPLSEDDQFFAAGTPDAAADTPSTEFDVDTDDDIPF